MDLSDIRFMTYRARYAVYFVINKAIGCVHLAACMSVRTLERIFAFEGSAATSVANIAVHTSWDFRSSQTRKEAKLSWIDFTSVVCGHVYSRILRFRDIVVGYWQTVGFCCDLDIAIDCFGRDGGCAQAGVDP
jgi:hypothetical protein